MRNLPEVRLSGQRDPRALAYAESTEADSRMVREDIWGSEAHCLMLARQGLIGEDDAREILRGLQAAREDWEAGRLVLRPELEDVHMNVEQYVHDRAGREMGGRLHTARSRNDQVLCDCKLCLRGRLLDVAAGVADLQRALLGRAAEHVETVMPGFTHTQHAQPITAGFWLSAHASALARDGERLREAFARTNTSPLGACALAGTSFETDRAFTARLLGFEGVHEHSLDLISSRDFVAESIAAAAILMSNLSKLAEEIILFTTHEYRMVELDDQFAFGSSIMPQKKNPCVAELARARTGVVYGRLMQVLTMMKATPLGYNRDVQEDKPPLWEAMDCTEDTLAVLAGATQALKLNEERMRELAGAYFEAATELANFLVREKGLPFRSAHSIIGGVVLKLAGEKKTFEEHARVRELLAAEGLETDAQALREVLDPACIVRAQRSLGSTEPGEVRRMIGDLQASAEGLAEWVSERREQIDAAQRLTAEGVARLIGGGSIQDWAAG